MQFQKATVQLNHEDIIEAIRSAVASGGWSPGKVEIAVDPGEHRQGPRRISATVEVEAPGREPAMATAKCRACGREIHHNGRGWEHVGEPKPRHPAVPVVPLRGAEGEG